MLLAEWINIAFFLFFLGLALLRPVERRQEWRAVALSVTGISLVASFYFLDMRGLHPAFRVIREFLPAPLILMVYWQAGQLVPKTSHATPHLALQLDRLWLADSSNTKGHTRLRKWSGEFFELAYLFCYPLVPLAFSVCYLSGESGCADQFWRIVLPPTYFCYALVPFFPHLSPRMYEQGVADISPSRIRRLNLWILHHGSIGVNTFPSAHVAASVAASLAILPRLPWIGMLFLAMALSIAVGVVVRRYHFALDSFGAVALAVATFLFNVLVLK